ncbi:VIT1/CCC1 transporter family protein [Corynebacterium bovis]|uniref:Rubrerythrin family protein n=1 Tax=Corynebacterium bovis TaxID=36808 RepID=A0A426Q0N5_9CORY|nr:VIT1/CCC1 transporter family protein [Corynebacterium bovis]MDN8579124.1 VIT1/CCC1 transporter family protein [Corynebacterium bovis]RRO87666.1 rubrerythrin family protein [Corynebacterium bovis]RRO89026.1 rubrerythrin family protein [Corynebacterium bovis]
MTGAGDHRGSGAGPGGGPDGDAVPAAPTGGDAVPAAPTGETPTPRQIARWRRYLANERAEGAVYRELARKKTGEERAILLAIADAEARHEDYWRTRLGEYVGLPRKASPGTRVMAWMARRFGSVFVLALMQSAETRNDYIQDNDASERMAADEAIHAEVVRGLASRGRAQMSGNFRAAVFGANDGLVSNLALVLGVIGSGVSSHVVLVTGVAGLLSGALSMAAGEYVSVSSQRELLAASTPDPEASEAVPKLDVDANELALVYRARGMEPEEARVKAARVFADLVRHAGPAGTGGAPADAVGEGSGGTTGAPTGEVLTEGAGTGTGEGSGGEGSRPAIFDAVDRQAREDIDAEDATGSPVSAALSSFLCFAGGAVVPVLPFILGLQGTAAAVLSCVLVSVALMLTGGLVGLLSGMSPGRRALRQWVIGMGAAAVTYGLGALFNVTTG